MRAITIVLMPRPPRFDKEGHPARFEKAKEACLAALDEYAKLVDPSPPVTKRNPNGEPRYDRAADALGLHQSAASEFRNGKRQANLDLALRLSEALGWSLERVLGRKVILSDEEIADFVDALSWPTGNRLYQRMKARFDDAIEEARVVTTPTIPPPPQLMPKPEAEPGAAVAETATNPKHKRKKKS